MVKPKLEWGPVTDEEMVVVPTPANAESPSTSAPSSSSSTSTDTSSSSYSDKPASKASSKKSSGKGTREKAAPKKRKIANEKEKAKACAHPPPPEPTRLPGQRKDYHYKLFKTPKEGASGVYVGFGAGLMMTVIGGGSGGLNLSPTLLNLLGASLFPYALMLIIFTGAELFTGNVMVDLIGLLNGTITLRQLALHLFLVYFGNFIGVWLADNMRDGDLVYAQYAASLVMKKVVDYGWGVYLIKGVFCNILVCLSVFMSIISESQEGKILSIWVPVMAFVVLGMEHSIANMFLVPAALMLLGGGHHYGGRDPSELTFTYHDFRGDYYNINLGNLTLEDTLRHVGDRFPHFGDFVAWNLIPVSLGNMIGGALLGLLLWYSFLTPRILNPPCKDC